MTSLLCFIGQRILPLYGLLHLIFLGALYGLTYMPLSLSHDTELVAITADTLLKSNISPNHIAEKIFENHSLEYITCQYQKNVTNYGKAPLVSLNPVSFLLPHQGNLLRCTFYRPTYATSFLLFSLFGGYILVLGYLLALGARHLDIKLEQIIHHLRYLTPTTLRTLNIVSEHHPFTNLQQTLNRALLALYRYLKQQQDTTKQLSRSEHYLTEVINVIPTILIAVNTHFQIIEWNITAEKVFQIKKSTALKKFLYDVLPMLQIYKQSIERALATGDIDTLTRQEIVLNEENRCFNITISPLMLTHSGLILMIDDITQMIYLENLMIHNEKMSSLGILAAQMAHEINNPLSSILQNIQNIERRFDASLAKNQEVAAECNIELELTNRYLQQRHILKFLANIREAGSRATTIVKNTLKISRKGESKKVKTNLIPLLTETLEIFKSDLDLQKIEETKKIITSCSFQEKLPNIICFPDELQQVILNIAHNAAHTVIAKGKMIPEFVPEVLFEVSTQQDFVKIAITDNGQGIPATHLKKIFEPFFTTKEVGIGTGLGLAICYSIIVNKHKGHLQIESEVDVGSTFVILLPLDTSTTL